VGKKNRSLRPTPVRTLRVLGGAEYERFRSPVVAACWGCFVTDHQYTWMTASFLAEMAWDEPWTRDRLEEAFTPLLGDKAGRLADRLIDLYPVAPFELTGLR
jgi:RNA-directed DNA polymerase